MKHVPHEITFIAFVRNDDGTLSVFDIVETSTHHAALFFRRFRRHGLVCAVDVCPPGSWRGRRIEFAS